MKFVLRDFVTGLDCTVLIPKYAMSQCILLVRSVVWLRSEHQPQPLTVSIKNKSVFPKPLRESLSGPQHDAATNMCHCGDLVFVFSSLLS